MKPVPVAVETFSPPEISYSRICEYARCPTPGEEMMILCREAVEEMEKKLSFRVCSARYPCRIQGEVCDLGFGTVSSASLARAFSDCTEFVLFAATVGVEADRLITRYSTLSPGKALVMSAVGTQRVEALCDAFCERLEKEEGEKGNLVRPRFSPGYGDLPLSFQNAIFSVLSPRCIGIALNDRCFMTPTKSVTALVGICKK